MRAGRQGLLGARPDRGPYTDRPWAIVRIRRTPRHKVHSRDGSPEHVPVVFERFPRCVAAFLDLLSSSARACECAFCREGFAT